MPDRTDYLDRLTGREAEALRPLLVPTVLAEGSFLFRQGDRPDSLFLIHRGLVKVMQSTEVGRDLILEFLFPGDLCGVLCSLGPDPYDMSAVCLTETEVSRIPRGPFMELSERLPGLYLKAVDVCRRKVRTQRRTFVTMTLQKAEQRAARALLALAGALGQRDATGMHMRMPLDRENFSEMIGTTVETAIRALSRLRRKGLIEEHGHEILLKDEKALRSLARL